MLASAVCVMTPQETQNLTPLGIQLSEGLASWGLIKGPS